MGNYLIYYGVYSNHIEDRFFRAIKYNGEVNYKIILDYSIPKNTFWIKVYNYKLNSGIKLYTGLRNATFVIEKGSVEGPFINIIIGQLYPREEFINLYNKNKNLRRTLSLVFNDLMYYDKSDVVRTLKGSWYILRNDEKVYLHLGKLGENIKLCEAVFE